jgi:hypothetical protein
MIIFTDKITGEVIGTIDGRTHSEQHLKMWIGEKDKTVRTVIEWKPVKFVDEKNKEVKKDKVRELRLKGKRVRAIWEPQHTDKEIFKKIDRRELKIQDYKLNKTGHFIKTKRKKPINNLFNQNEDTGKKD